MGEGWGSFIRKAAKVKQEQKISMKRLKTNELLKNRVSNSLDKFQNVNQNCTDERLCRIPKSWHPELKHNIMFTWNSFPYITNMCMQTNKSHSQKRKNHKLNKNNKCASTRFTSIGKGKQYLVITKERSQYISNWG